MLPLVNHRRTRRLAALLMTCCSLLALSSGSAGAEVWRGADPRGDTNATTYSPEPEPCGTLTNAATNHGDLTRLVVDHGRRALRLRLAVDGLRGLSDLSVGFRVRTAVRDYSIDVDRYGRRWHVSVTKPPEVPDDAGECGFYSYLTYERECHGADVSISRGRGLFDLRLPRACVGEPRWVRVGASLYGELPSGAWARDTWAPDGDEQGDDFALAYGPRVLAGPAS